MGRTVSGTDVSPWARVICSLKPGRSNVPMFLCLEGTTLQRKWLCFLTGTESKTWCQGLRGTQVHMLHPRAGSPRQHHRMFTAHVLHPHVLYLMSRPAHMGCPRLFCDKVPWDSLEPVSGEKPVPFLWPHTDTEKIQGSLTVWGPRETSLGLQHPQSKCTDGLRYLLSASGLGSLSCAHGAGSWPWTQASMLVRKIFAPARDPAPPWSRLPLPESCPVPVSRHAVATTFSIKKKI